MNSSDRTAVRDTVAVRAGLMSTNKETKLKTSQILQESFLRGGKQLFLMFKTLYSTHNQTRCQRKGEGRRQTKNNNKK